MSIPTVAVTCTAYDQNGNAVAGGTFRARLNSTEIYNGFVVPEQVTGVADASGVCVLQLWPNALGVAGSAYRITAINPDTGQKYLDTTAVVPNSACNLHQIIVAAPYPTVDASEQALVAAQGALAAVIAQAGIATTKAAEASASATTATTQAGIATTQAGTATTQAGIATTQATTATTQADIAAIQAGIATTQAGTATTQAGTATTQAGIATTKASEAAASAATATTQAGTATTQAGVATTKASEAAASATNANNSAYTAGLSVDAAVTAKNQAVSSASAAASSATAASGSATAASTSASSASASASTATTQAGTATTQAGLATTAATTATSKASEASTYASNASASANTATTQAGVATTQAGIATTQAGVATTQAGIAIANANAALSVYGSVTAQQAAVTAAQNAATSATASAAAANTSAGAASGSAASALAIYGTTAAQQAALTNAQSAASLAQGYALSASSAIQQDLSGVTAQALHRSPNAVTAMFVYDTSKDSDGGAWTERCQHTSWYNEALNGKWLGAHDSELLARISGATLGSELVINNDFLNSATGWTLSTAGSSLSVASGIATFTCGNTAYPSLVSTGFTTVIGKQYVLRARARKTSGNSTALAVGSSSNFGSNLIANKELLATTGFVEYALAFTATATTTYVGVFGGQNPSTGIVEIDNISVREVTALTTASGDYYQNTVDGKFYRLWKNLLKQSNLLSDSVWAKANATVEYGYPAPDGTNTAWKVTLPNGGGGSQVYQNVLSVGAINQNIWIRADTSSSMGYGYYDSVMDVATITVTTTWTNFTKTRSSGLTSSDRRAQWLYSDNANTVIYVWRPQVEYGSTATTYEAKTADGPITETFRGNKADFPRLAGIVAEAASVTIYDLTEAGRPMWMRFRADTNTVPNSSIFNRGFYYTMSDVEALSGKLLIGNATNAAERLLSVDFVKDSAFLYSSDAVINYGTYGGLFTRSLAQRNSSGIGMFVNNGYTPLLANGAVNAVAMTVLPDAPIDPVTGLQVPTIAVATAGGVSVIKHDGTVVSHTQNVLSDSYNLVITKDGCIAYHNGGGPLRVLPIAALPVANTWYFYSPSPVGESYYIPQYTQITGKPVNGNRTVNYDSPNLASLAPGNGTKITLAKNGYDLVVGGTYLKRAKNNTLGLMTASLLTPTGFMRGDIRRAYLADTDVGNVSGTELVTNGDFSSGTTGWTAGQAATLTVTDGVMKVAASGNLNWGECIQAITTVVGKTYRVSLSNMGGTGTLYIRAAAVEIASSTAVFVATSTTTNITIKTGSATAGVFVTFDNISVQEVVPDRSYKAQAASITGTLTKTQVAAASQLVAYSGFSAANYLREPYSADLDFAQGEWSASAWVNVPVTLPVGSFPIVGSELTTNGSFDSDTAWTKSTGISISGGQCVCAAAPGASSALYQSAAVSVGKWYRYEIVVSSFTAGSGLQPRLFGMASPFGSINAAGTYVYYGSPTTANTNIGFSLSDTTTCTVDFISVKEVGASLIADRSFTTGSAIKVGVDYGGKLIATAFDGTTTRTVTTTAAYNTATWIKPEAVYTTDGTLAIRVNGVEVAATRGTPLLSLNSRYNLLTYTEDFANAAWTKTGVTVTANAGISPDGTITSDALLCSGNSNHQFIGALATSGSSVISIYVKQSVSPCFYIGSFSHGGTVYFDLVNKTVSSLVSPAINASIVDSDNGFVICKVTLSAVSNYLHLGFLDAVYTGTSTSPWAITTQATEGFIWGASAVPVALAALPYQRVGASLAETQVAPLTIGNSFAADAPFPGSISLLKLSATVPTAEQSQWMYEQEKQMFRDGAQVALPDAGSIVDLAYDDATDKWLAVSATNESEWSGLVRTSVTASPAGSYSKITATSGVQMQARTTTNPGVDVTIPSYGLREELVNRSQAAARLARNMVAFDYVGGFTANTTTGSTAIASVASLTYPVSYVGARISGAGIPANTTVVAVSGTTIYISAAATATASAVQISFVDFNLPVGYEAREVLTAGLAKIEGSTKDFTRLYDGFKETIRFGAAPGYNAAVQIQATRSAA